MIESQESYDDRPRRGQEEAESPSSPSPYDPLLAPWDDVLAPASSSADALKRDQIFGFDWGTQPESTILRPPTAHQRPYAEVRDVETVRRSPPAQAVALPRPRQRWAMMAREIAEVALLAVLIFLALRVSFETFRVDGTSMMPNLEDNQQVIVNKLAYARIDTGIFDWLPFIDAGEDSVHHLWAAPGRGDVIVFQSPRQPDQNLVKRIIAVPGDFIQILPQLGIVMVNGKFIVESYVDGETPCIRSCDLLHVPPGHYFVMGDDRHNSRDSREGWLVPEENIIGKALITFWGDGGLDLNLAPNRSIKFTDMAPQASK